MDISFLATIPNVIWSAVIGSVLALSGVFLSNRNNTARLKLQLQHDADEKAKERTALLRHDVYLRTTEELVKTNAYLAALPQLDASKTNLSDGFQGFFSAAARLQLVAEPKTALLANALVGEYGELILSLMKCLAPANSAKSEIQIANDNYSRAQGEVARVLAEMTRLNESGNPDSCVFQALQRSFDFHQEQSLKFSNESQDAWLRFNAYGIKFQKFLLSRLRELAPRQLALMIEIRKDLGLDGDLHELETQMRDQMERMVLVFDSFISELSESTATGDV